MSHLNLNQLSEAQPDAVGLAEKFMEIVPQAMRELRTEFRAQRGTSLTIPQFRVLARLKGQSQTNKELAEHIGVSVATMSRMVDGLIAQNLVEKFTGDHDRREVAIQLSGAGQKLYASIRCKSRQNVAKRLAGLSRAELKLLGLGLDVIARSFF